MLIEHKLNFYYAADSFYSQNIQTENMDAITRQYQFSVLYYMQEKYFPWIKVSKKKEIYLPVQYKTAIFWICTECFF